MLNEHFSDDQAVVRKQVEQQLADHDAALTC